MANKFTNPQHFQDIAAAIRFINGLNTKYTPPQMAQAILDLSVGSGSLPALLSIQIVSPPNTTNYLVGDIFRSTGLKVKALYENGYYKYVTNNVTLSIQNGYEFKAADVGVITSLTVTYQNKTQTVPITVSQPVYGVLWDGSSTTQFSRTDASENYSDPTPAVNNGDGSSPFDTKMPWAGIERIEDADAGTLVKIPKFYYKWTRDGASMKLQISPYQFTDSLVSPAHADRGDGSGERDYVYVGAYSCAETTYKSTSDVLPQVSTNIATFRTNIHNLGAKIWQWDFAMYWTIAMLYLVEYASWNSQASIGYGCSDSGSVQNSGLCDSMTYHTGTNATSRAAYGHTRYRYIEDLWGNVQNFVDGILFYNSVVECQKNPANFKNDSAQYTNLSGTRATSSGYPKTFTSPSTTGFEYALLPASVGGSNTTYIPDNYTYESGSNTILILGGDYTQNLSRGLFMYYNASTSRAAASIGSRLMMLP